MTKEVFTLTSPDGKTMELSVRKGTTGPDVVEIGRLYAEQGVFTYDPGFVSTGSCDSEITYIDGKEGVLMYRGYPVEQLAKHSNFIEVAYLLLYGELPERGQARGVQYLDYPSYDAERGHAALLHRFPL